MSYWKGKHPPSEFKKGAEPPKHKNNCSCFRCDKKEGKRNIAWKGKNVGYFGVHNWIEKKKGKPKKCENCGTEAARKYEWSNKDHKYRRILADYRRLCTKCHRDYDKKLKKGV